jgi:polyhydroxybutyrate depolymerase
MIGWRTEGMTRRRALATAFAVAAIAALGGSTVPASAARAPTPTVPSGTFPYTVEVDGVTRSAVVHVPVSVAARPDEKVPLVLHLHGGGGSPQNSIDTTRLVEASDTNGFIVVFPQGTPIAIALPDGSTGYVWNAGSCCAIAARENIDDVGFLDQLIRSLEQSLPVDADRVVMSGHSNGAMMAWRFACERGGVLAAAMPVSGSLETADPAACAPRGTSLLAVHGDADRNHPLEGGTGTRSVSGVSYRPFADSVAAYADASGCRTRPKVSAETIATTSRYRACRRGATVTSVVLHGADHPWPGAIASGVGIQGTPFPDWSATDALVQLVADTQ